MKTILDRLWRFAAEPGDSEDVALQKGLIAVVAASCCVCGLRWSLLYLAVFGVGLTMALPLLFVVLVGAAMVVAARRRDHRRLVLVQIACITWISALIEWSIGSVNSSGLVISWSFLGPIGALIFLPMRQAVFWMAQFLGIVAVSVIIEPALLGRVLPVSAATRAVFYTMNIGASLSVTFAAAAWFVRTIQHERERSEGLLCNMLPVSIARRLKDGTAIIADAHTEVSVLFADIVGFTTYSAQVGPTQLVNELNAIFRLFDEAAARHGIAKIKTIGDAYMAASGVPEPRTDHADRLAAFALEMVAIVAAYKRGDGERFSLWIGMHSGPRWRGSSDRRASRTTSGATPSTRPAAWSRMAQSVACR